LCIPFGPHCLMDIGHTSSQFWPNAESPTPAQQALKSHMTTPCGTGTRNLRISSPTPSPLGQGGRVIGKLISFQVETLCAARCGTDRADCDHSTGHSCSLYSCGYFSAMEGAPRVLHLRHAIMPTSLRTLNESCHVGGDGAGRSLRYT
jgi:hypothetical protein